MSQKITIAAQFWSIAQVAEALQVSTRTIQNWITADLLPAHRLGGLWRIADSDLQDFLKRTRNAATAVVCGGEPNGFAQAIKTAADQAECQEILEDLEAGIASGHLDPDAELA